MDWWTIIYIYVSIMLVASMIFTIIEDSKDLFKFDYVHWATQTVFWPIYLVKYGLRFFTEMLNCLIEDIIRW